MLALFVTSACAWAPTRLPLVVGASRHAPPVAGLGDKLRQAFSQNEVKVRVLEDKISEQVAKMEECADEEECLIQEVRAHARAVGRGQSSISPVVLHSVTIHH